jgi:hypothetical protein
MAKGRLAKDLKDIIDALLAMTFTAGLRSDFAAMIEKHNLAALHYTKKRRIGRSNSWRSIRIVMLPDLPVE